MNDDARYRDILVYIDEGYFDVDLVGNMTLLNPSMASVPYQVAPHYKVSICGCFRILPVNPHPSP